MVLLLRAVKKGISMIVLVHVVSSLSFTPASATKRKRNRKQHRNFNVYLLTFPTKSSTSDPLNSLFKQWKYFVLGDGGVYFDQRPNTLSTLNLYILERVASVLQQELRSSSSTSGSLDVECAVISTCKRFEIFISVELLSSPSSSKVGMKQIKDDKNGSNTIDDGNDGNNNNNNNNKNNNNNNNDNNNDNIINADKIKSIIAYTLAEQIIHYRKRLRIQKYIPFISSLPLDRPSRIINISHDIHPKKKKKIQAQVQEVEQNLMKDIVVVNDIHDIALRLLRLASGLLDRPIFRPFSSRDAHIMNQLKRSLNGSKRIIVNDDDNDNGGVTRRADGGCDGGLHNNNDNFDSRKNTKYTKILLDSALQAGKASRSSKVVPILDELRMVSNGADGPIDISTKAAQSAMKLAISPILNSCIDKFKAMEVSDAITSFREDVNEMIRERRLDLDLDGSSKKGKEQNRNLRRILHEPTIDLREGRAVDIDAIFERIEKEVQ